MEKINKNIEEIKDTLKNQPDVVPLDDVVDLHQHLVSLQSLEKALKRHIINQLRSGFKVNGYKLVKTKGQTGYVDRDEVLKRLMEHAKTGRNLLGLVNPISIAQLRKSLGADVVADLLGDLIITNPEGKDYDYAPLDDDRPEVK